MSWWGQHAMGAFGLVTEALKAAFLAEGGVAVGPAVAGHLAATIPPPSFFLT